MEAMLAQHCADIEKALEHEVLREHAHAKAQMAAQSAEGEQARQELAEERSRLASLLQKMDELWLNASVELNCQVHVNDRRQRAENEHKVMADKLAKVEKKRRILSEQLSKALSDRSLAEEELRSEQERVSDLSKELTTLLRQRRTIERSWSEEVNRLRG